MNCPACSKTLITLELDGFEIDRCFNCNGIWLNSGELDYLLSSEIKRVESQLIPAPKVITEKNKRCPECSLRMKKMLFIPGNILLDQCDNHGIWFDSTELEKIISSVKDENADVLANRLKNMLSGNR